MKKHDKEVLTFEFPRWRAKELGLLCCDNCGWPENNHFDFDERTCAHADCEGWVERQIG